MPDAIERDRVLAWLGQAHRVRTSIRTSRCAGVNSGNAIVFCRFIALWVLPPNRRVQSTPLRGHKIVRILKSDLSSNVISTYFGGAADAQHVRRTPSRASSVESSLL